MGALTSHNIYNKADYSTFMKLIKKARTATSRRRIIQTVKPGVYLYMRETGEFAKSTTSMIMHLDTSTICLNAATLDSLIACELMIQNVFVN